MLCHRQSASNTMVKMKRKLPKVRIAQSEASRKQKPSARELQLLLPHRNDHLSLSLAEAAHTLFFTSSCYSPAGVSMRNSIPTPCVHFSAAHVPPHYFQSTTTRENRRLALH